MIDLPANFITDLISVMGNTISDLLPLVLFIIGILIGVYIVSSIAWNTIQNKEDWFNKK